jgi:hypothetical protein
MSGNGITTSNNIDFTLRGAWYEVEFAITRHQGNATWRNNGIKVDGSAADTFYSGNDSGNWSGGSSTKILVNATLASRVVQAYRVNAANNGNGYLHIKQTSMFVIPEGVEARTALVLTCNGGAVQLNGGANATLYAGTSQRIMVAVPAGQVLSTVATTGGCTATISDGTTGSVEVAAPLGTTGAQTLTVTFVTPGAARVLTQANAGVAIAIGSIQVRMPSAGNRSFQVTSNTGSNITVRYQNVWNGGGGGIGIQSATLVPGTWTYFNSGFNFTSAGSNQHVLINDQTNGNRWYSLVMEVGASFNNNSFALHEVL